MTASGVHSIFLVRHGHIEAGGRFVSREDMPLSSLGKEQAVQLANMLGSVTFGGCLCSPLRRCRETAEIIARLNGSIVSCSFGTDSQDSDIWFADNVSQPVEVTVSATESATGSPPCRAGKAQGVSDGTMLSTMQIMQELREISLGAWEGLSREQVQRQYASVWAERGRHPAEVAPPDGENYTMLFARLAPVLTVLFSLVRQGNVLVVAHRSVNQALAGYLSGFPMEVWPRLSVPYGSVTVCPAARLTKNNPAD